MLEQKLDELVAKHEAAAIAVRRHLHAHPELGWHEFETQKFLRNWLNNLGMETRDAASTGLITEVGQGDYGVIYRGDIDALPIFEKKPAGTDYVSQNPGVCHACGHDVHAAVAALLASVFNELGPELDGRVRFIFQPAEEVVPSGAEAMIVDGAAVGISAALALHVDPTRQVGDVGVRTGALTSATDTFSIKITGQAGHSARPFLAKDAILASADVIRSLYTLIGQRVNPMYPAVLNVGTIHGGEAKNVIAGEVELTGVVRTLQKEVRELLHREMREVATAAAKVHGCSVQMVLATGAPPVMNDEALYEIVKDSAADVIGHEHIDEIDFPSTGAEDFGMFGIHMPQFMLRLGVRAPGDEVHHLHTPGFDVDESALAIAARVMGRAILRTLAARR
ncbi:MAG: amidohydrolase [Bradymonadia bacterium]|jgi:amidohydrolase